MFLRKEESTTAKSEEGTQSPASGLPKLATHNFPAPTNLASHQVHCQLHRTQCYGATGKPDMRESRTYLLIS
jgi:hypothetical protein